MNLRVAYLTMYVLLSVAALTAFADGGSTRAPFVGLVVLNALVNAHLLLRARLRERKAMARVRKPARDRKIRAQS